MLFKRGLLRSHSSGVLALFRALDGLAVLISGLASYYLVSGTLLPDSREREYLLIIAVATFVLVGEWVGLYRSQRGKGFASEAARITFVGLAVAIAVVVSQQTVAWGEAAIRTGVFVWLAHWLLILFVGIILFRLALRALLQWLRSKGWNLRHVVIIGTSDNLKSLSDALAQHPEFGLCVDGFADDRAADRHLETGGYQWLGAVADLKTYIADNQVDQVWIAYPALAVSRCQEALDMLREFTVDIRFLMHTNQFTGSNATFTDFAGLPLLDIEVTPLEGLGYFLKTIEDKVVAALVLIVAAPLFIAIAIGVKFSSPGPVFYRQERISWNNRTFMMFKFRTMPVDVEHGTGPKWASEAEDRATRFGALLRRTSLDELPQFINVLKGDMSVVGPRPERPFFVEQFKDQIPLYMKKHMVKAGITGWAQVNGLRGDTNLEERIEHDLFYIRNWSLVFDLHIAIKTLVSGFINKNAY
jgi:putative colanic acid biosynthesis UDP-glucose lipid carrier transferase